MSEHPDGDFGAQTRRIGRHLGRLAAFLAVLAAACRREAGPTPEAPPPAVKQRPPAANRVRFSPGTEPCAPPIAGAVSLPAPPPPDGTRFAPVRRYTAGASGPVSPVLADLDGDGRPDVVTANANGGDVSVFLQTAAGGFSTPRNYESGLAPRATAVGDLNGDRKPDVVTVHVDGAVAVHLGRGDGSLDPARRFEAGRSMAGLVLGDFDRDGKLDVASATTGLSAVSVFLGNGDGTLKAPKHVSVGAAPMAIAAAHLDGDGNLDIATANGGANDITILFGGGDGTFPRRRKYPTSACPQSLALADVDLDGHVDVVVLVADNRGPVGALNVYFNRGDGTLDDGAWFSIDKGWWWASPLVVADADGDGKPDVIVGDPAGAIRVLLGTGDGAFKAPQRSPAPTRLSGLAVGDVTGHGKIDALTTHEEGANLAVLAGRGNGSFQSAATYGGKRSPTRLVTADFNRDGVADVASWNELGTSITAWLGRGGRELGDPIVTDLSSLEPREQGTGAVASDFEGNGAPSIAVARGKELVIAFGLGDGRFGRPATFALSGLAVQLAVADFNLDGRPDVAAAIAGDADVLFDVLLGRAGGKLDAPLRTRAPRGGKAYASGIATGDFNGDGKPDAIATLPAQPTAWGAQVFLGNGDGTFAPGARYENVGVAFLAVADVNRDGKLDVLTRNTEQRLAVLLGKGDGTFATPLLLDIGAGRIHQVDDVNGDGIPDLVAQRTLKASWNFIVDALTVWLGTGDGRFVRDGEYIGGTFLRDVIVGNLVARGRGDLLVADPTRASLGVLRNVSGGP